LYDHRGGFWRLWRTTGMSGVGTRIISLGGVLLAVMISVVDIEYCKPKSKFPLRISDFLADSKRLYEQIAILDLIALQFVYV
jgi:hypothetical protein